MSIAMATEHKEPEAGATGGPEIMVNKRYSLLPGSRLPELDLGNAQAVVASDHRNPDDKLFARICADGTFPRTAELANLRHMMEANVMRPLDAGPVRWPGEEGHRLAVVFRRPEHGVLMASSGDKVTALKTEEISRTVLGPIVLTLAYMTQRSVTHRSIRPDNIYWSGGGRNSVMLGDCISHPPASLQPVVFETIESGMTPPTRRGPGTPADDFYSLGVTLLALATGNIPLKGMSDANIIQEKLRRGSFSALMAGERPPFGLRELLRGLLTDSPHERWGLEQLEQWLGGSLRSTVQEKRIGHVERVFEFSGKSYSNLRAVAQAFGEDWKSAAKAIKDPGFLNWLSRSVSDESLIERISMVVNHGADSDSRGNIGAHQVSQVCVLLDLCGPIRYKGLVVMPNAVGGCLAEAFKAKDKETIGLVAELISSGAAADWYDFQSATDQIQYEAEIKQLKHLQGLLRHTGPGYGIERCLYMLNTNIPCASDILRGHYISDIRDMLPLLEKLSVSNGGLATVIDRHLAAFLASRVRVNIDRQLAKIENADGDKNVIKLAMLGIFARTQFKFGPDELPHLTKWFAEDLEQCVDRINSKSMREQLRKKIRSLSGTGRLTELYSCLSNDKVFLQDANAKKRAIKEFADAAREIAQLESNEFQETAQRQGWRLASGISASVAVATLVFVAMS
jgi:hypothetical protein